MEQFIVSIFAKGTVCIWTENRNMAEGPILKNRIIS